VAPAPAAPNRSANDDEQTFERSPSFPRQPRGSHSKKGAEAGTANSALTQGGRCPNVRQPLTNPGPDLHPSDELPVLCQTSLRLLIGRQPPLSTPQTQKKSPLSSGRAGARHLGGVGDA